MEYLQQSALNETAIKAMRIPNPHARTTEDRPFISPTREKVPREYEFGNSYSITAGWGIRRLAVSIQPDRAAQKRQGEAGNAANSLAFVPDSEMHQEPSGEEFIFRPPARQYGEYSRIIKKWHYSSGA